MKANYYDYNKLWDRLYTNVPLTDERLSDNVLQIAGYLRDNGAIEVVENLGLGLRCHIEYGKKTTWEIYFTTGPNKERALTLWEIRDIGIMLLRHKKED